jgi:GMP synthase (glutamine-hydrolysing)
MQVLAFRHTPLEDIGLIADSLERNGLGCRYVDLYANAEPVSLQDIAGLILMGGPMSVNDDLPWLRAEIQCVREAILRGMPVLGVCLGAQLIAKSLGARVFRNPVKEIGWAPVYWTGEARKDRLFASFVSPETIFHWHGETFDLPAGAELLAYSDACRNQAFRSGSNVYGLQFHAEVTPEMIQEWCRQDESCGSAREMQGPIDPHANAPRLAEIAATVFDRWCGLVA